MNHLSRILTVLLIVSVGLLSFNCGGSDDPEKSEEEVQLEKLKAGQWSLLTANDGSDRTSEYPGMTLTFTGTFAAGGTYAYTSSATSWPSPSPWEDEGTWKFASDSV